MDRKVSNFSKDIKDSEVYTHLMHQIAPKDAGVNKLALQKSDLTERAEETLKQADKIDCNEFVTPYDIVHGIEKVFIGIQIRYLLILIRMYVLLINFSA